MKLRVHQWMPRSRANGPGWRAVVWVQGCSLGCPGCFNPETHTKGQGTTIETGELFERINATAGPIEGVTISGGEPLEQAGAVSEFLRLIKSKSRLSVLLFTGFTWEEIQDSPSFLQGELGRAASTRLNGDQPVGGFNERAAWLKDVDVLIAGRYDSTRRLARGLIGSTNKTVHFLSHRYSQADLLETPDAEVILDGGGQVTLTGIRPVHWSSGAPS